MKSKGNDGHRAARVPEDNLAASMLSEGHVEFRTADDGSARGLFCGMGICGECRVHVPGRGTVRACMTPAETHTEVAPHRSDRLPDTAPSNEGALLAVSLTPDVLIVGAGPAGLSAAETCANAGLSVVVLDERVKPGGQFYKQPTAAFFARLGREADPQAMAGKALIERTLAAGATILSESVVWAADPDLTCYANIKGSQYAFSPKTLVLATGAFERPMPFPGWTLPGVMTTGAIQTMLRSYGVVPGRRVLIAGNGPLNIQVAVEAMKSRAKVVGVAEAAPLFAADRVMKMVKAGIASPILTARGAQYLATLKRARVPILTSTAVSSVERNDNGLCVSLTRLDAPSGASEPTHKISADSVGLGYGFLPSGELSRLLGCMQENEGDGILRTKRSEVFETSVPDVFQIGDSARLEGAPAALVQGVVAGLAIVKRQKGVDTSVAIKAANKTLRSRRNFQKHLWQAFKAPILAARFVTDDTIICRCENVRYADVKLLIAAGEKPPNIKRSTRCGMGACQGRYCGWILQQFLLTSGFESTEFQTHWAPRAPLRSMSMQVLAIDPARGGQMPVMPKL